MYKLTILFFFLTAFNSQSLMDSYKITFDNENATYILQIKEGSLVMKNQPNVTVTAIVENNPAADTDKKTSKIYKITKGATWQEGLKIGEEDIIIAHRDMNELLFDEKDHQVYEIILSYNSVIVVETSSKMKAIFPIEGGIYLNVSDGKFVLFR